VLVRDLVVGSFSVPSVGVSLEFGTLLTCRLICDFEAKSTQELFVVDELDSIFSVVR